MGVIGTICIVSELLHQVKLMKVGHAAPIGGRLYESPEASGGAETDESNGKELVTMRYRDCKLSAARFNH